MIGSAAAWRRMLKLWLPGLVLLIANMGVLSTYRFLLAGQAQMRSSRVERLSTTLAELEEHRLALDDVKTEAGHLKSFIFYHRMDGDLVPHLALLDWSNNGDPLVWIHERELPEDEPLFEGRAGIPIYEIQAGESGLVLRFPIK